MVEIALVVDAITRENGLQSIYDRLRSAYSVGLLQLSELKKASPKLVVTNLVDALHTKYPTIFILTASDGSPILNCCPNTRRAITNTLKMSQAVVVYSSFAAKEVSKDYKIRPIVQYPMPPSPRNSPQYILYSHVPNEILSAFPKYEFREYKCLDDLKGAKLYIDMTKGYECSNIRLGHAAMQGVPCVARASEVNKEMASGGDLLLSEDASNQWIKAIKVALRDRLANSEKNRASSDRFRNAGDLDRKIDNIMGKRPNAPQARTAMREQKVKDKLKQLKNAEKTKVMGRRETSSERERRSKRFQRKSKRVTRQHTTKEGAEVSPYVIENTPSWFTSTDRPDVSIIVPMYRSRKAVEKQIASWDLEDDGLKKEIIYVDDGCPINSYATILPSWEKRRQYLKGRPIGKLVVSSGNRGYGPACNLGAKVATGKYLIFLNADAEVLPDWVRPMYDLFPTDPNIGIVGNLHLRLTSDQYDVDSAGSEFSWSGGHFEHIGRNIYHGSRIPKPFKLRELPADLNQIGQREMVTGCCFMISKDLFLRIGGYDEAYKIGYWEDSDMNLSVRELGYKVMFQPQSKIIHTGGHSRAGGHNYTKQNRDRFYHRWVETGFVDKIASNRRPEKKPVPIHSDLKSAVNGEVVGCIIACNEEEFLEASVRSIAPMVDRFLFVVGGNHYAYKAGMCDANGLPSDNTVDIVRSLCKEFNGTVIEPPRRLWNGKTEMRNAYAKHIRPGSWMFMLDGDEVYKPGQLWVLADKMRTYECFRMQYYLFWNNMETLGTGSWGGYPQERIVKWKEGYHYKAPNHLAVSDASGKQIAFRVPTYNGDERFFYHYSWVRPIEKIQQKIDYYRYQLKDEWGHTDVVGDYVNDVFLKWRTDPESVKETHPRGGGSTSPFGGIHPYEVTQLIQAGKLNF